MKQKNSSVIVSPRESIGVQAAAYRLGISVGRVRTLLGQGRIEGAQKLGRRWQIPTRRGMPKIVPGHRGPQGNWYLKQRTQNGFIHANQHLLRLNRKDGGSRPAIGVKLGKHSQYCHYVEIKGRSRLVYSPTQPSSNCRARLWMEVPPEVPVGGSKFETPGGTRGHGDAGTRGHGDGETGRIESRRQISFTQTSGKPEASGRSARSSLSVESFPPASATVARSGSNYQSEQAQPAVEEYLWEQKDCHKLRRGVGDRLQPGVVPLDRKPLFGLIKLRFTPILPTTPACQ